MTMGGSAFHVNRGRPPILKMDLWIVLLVQLEHIANILILVTVCRVHMEKFQIIQADRVNFVLPGLIFLPILMRAKTVVMDLLNPLMLTSMMTPSMQLLVCNVKMD